MASTAILVGNATYASENDLPCGRNDVMAMRELLAATGRFEKIIDCFDFDADSMREAVRAALPAEEKQDEVFFYFSGHGSQLDGNFYYCGTKFDSRRPNDTGMSHAELHGLFRSASPTTLVVVIDACYSGMPLIKKDLPPPPLVSEGFKNVFQFASSMYDQPSMGGETLSDYTQAFIEASIKKTDGAVYYTDVSNILRDSFINNDGQTPFFVYQGTGRETLVDDAKKLDEFRVAIASRLGATRQPIEDVGAEDDIAVDLPEPPTALQLLLAAEERIGSADQTKKLIASLFDGVKARAKFVDFTELFETEVTEKAHYDEPTIEEFMIRVLSREKRPDRLVTAEVKMKKRKPTPLETLSAGFMAAWNQDYIEQFDLRLNCSLERAQLTLKLTPRFRTLQRLTLVLSCAPSLEHCYVFEMVTTHPRTDWDSFDTEGEQAVRRWYKLGWDEGPASLVEKVAEGLLAAVKKHVEEMTKRLASE
ncbi:caspase family protein [Rhizobium sp. BG4]|uniref:caspase family protein n=1 Tax=Rhizobium sp. BG4 TaxID=2613770 RepID=UPI00193E8DF8|nr:caspase family protein [Rhizobium sp. BG4]